MRGTVLDTRNKALKKAVSLSCGIYILMGRERLMDNLTPKYVLEGDRCYEEK